MSSQASFAFVAFVLLASLASGCLGGSDVGGFAEETTSPTAPDVEVSTTHGAIEGLVIDESILPLANVTVSLARASGDEAPIGQVVTMENGRFVFSRLVPGPYTVAAEAIGFAKHVLLVQVVAEKVTQITVTLDDVPSREPFIETHIHVQEISCRFAAVVLASTGQCTEVATAGLLVNVSDGFRLIVAESIWEDSQNYLLLQFLATNETLRGNLIRNHQSQPPHRTELWPGVQDQNFSNAVGAPRPVPASSFDMSMFSLYAGQYADEIDSVARPICVTYDGKCKGVGVTLQTRFTTYLSIFMHGLPRDYDAYTGLPDA